MTPSASPSRSTWRVLRAFAPFYWLNKGTVAVASVTALLGVAATIVTPWPLKFIIDNVLGEEPLPPMLATWTAGLSSSSQILAFAAVAALAAITGTLFASLTQILLARVRERMTLEMRDRLLAHIQTLPLVLTGTLRSGEIVMRLVGDVHLVVRLYTKTLPDLVTNAVTTLAVLAVMVAIDVRLGLLGLAMVLVLVWMSRQFLQPLYEATKAKRRGEGDVGALAQEIVRGLPSIQVLRAEAPVRGRFRDSNVVSLRAGLHQTRIAVGLQRSLSIARGLAIAGVTGGGALLVLDGRISLGVLTVCVAYISDLLRPVTKINESATSISRSVNRGEQLLDLLALHPAVEDQPGAVDVPRSRGHLALRSVAFRYPAGDSRDAPGLVRASVLQGVDLELEPGSFTVLIGKSGGGKSTLFRLALRLFDPDAGELLLDGRPYRDITLRSLREQFAVMLQDTHLFAGSVREAIQPADAVLPDDALWNVLSKVVMREFVQALPGGLDAELHEEGINLSGGQRARLSLARALLQQRPFLLLDEPLANVDAHSQTVIIDALASIRGQVTCLVISHQPVLTELADTIFRIDDGRLLPVRPVANDGSDPPSAVLRFGNDPG